MNSIISETKNTCDSAEAAESGLRHWLNRWRVAPNDRTLARVAFYREELERLTGRGYLDDEHERVLREEDGAFKGLPTETIAEQEERVADARMEAASKEELERIFEEWLQQFPSASMPDGIAIPDEIGFCLSQIATSRALMVEVHAEALAECAEATAKGVLNGLIRAGVITKKEAEDHTEELSMDPRDVSTRAYEAQEAQAEETARQREHDAAFHEAFHTQLGALEADDEVRRNYETPVRVAESVSPEPNPYLEPITVGYEDLRRQAEIDAARTAPPAPPLPRPGEDLETGVVEKMPLRKDYPLLRDRVPPEHPVLARIEKQLADVLSREGVDSMADTPDFMLAQVAMNHLRGFIEAAKRRDAWLGKE